MRLDNLSVLDHLTLADVEKELDRHTRVAVEPDRWTMFTWSVSRNQLFEDCKRAYYLNYYGARRVREAKSKVVSAIWWLKQIRPLKTWLGSVIHEVAKSAVRAHADGQPLDPKALVRRALEYYRGGIQASLRGSKLDGQWVVLFEHVYQPDEPLDVDAAAARVEAMTRTLIGSDAMGFILNMPPDSVLEVDEEFQSFQLDGVLPHGPLTVFAIPDVLLESDDNYYIIDWKTGSVSRQGIRDQAGVYQFYVHQNYDAPEGAIHVAISDIGDTGESVSPEGGIPSLEDTRDFIAESTGEMLARLTDRGRNAASIKDYPMTDNLETCASCGFKRACWRHV